ncbi:MAG: methionine adenosyltransferase domain-containing protein [Alphaproteobacteria bacterium]|nr:methionine adenosyltransferase domain-containing protein [Alphaproteobacteria bacterium]
MNKTAEYVSLGHPDKIADYISSSILDECLKQDINTRYAVEVMVKNNNIILGGEIKGNITLKHIKKHIKQALRKIGYDEEYNKLWQDNAININKLKITNLISAQSEEIAQGVEQNGWGDQGVFVGYATQGEEKINYELFLAKKLNNALYQKALAEKNLGLDIKTQITIDENNRILTAIVAIPMLEKEDLRDFVIQTLNETPKNIIINGTGSYTTHSSIADCGITGRKLACDFYSTACPIGGGSPWTKDASKADLTLNLYARKLAIDYLKDNDECYVYLSSCIGKKDLPSAVVKTQKNNKETTQNITPLCNPKEIIELLKLNRPIYKKLCSTGLINYINSKGKPKF